MISHSHKFVHIHINKTAGTSIEQTLLFCLDANMTGHKSASQVKEIIGPDKYNKYFSFTIIRNPWDRLLSVYSFRRDKNMITQSFDEWLHDPETFLEKTMFLNNQLDWITNERGKIIVDYLGRFENLQKSWSVVSDAINIHLPLPWLNASNHEHYSEYYNQRSRGLVMKFFERDIDYFKYRF